MLQISAPATSSPVSSANHTDVIIMADTAVSESDLQTMKQSLKKLVNAVEFDSSGDVHVGLVSFGPNSNSEIALSSDKSAVLAAIDALSKKNGNANAAKALDEAKTMFGNSGRPAAKKSSLLLSSGE